MDIYLFHREKYDLYYNCSFYDAETMMPLEKRQHRLIGSFFIAGYAIFLPLYIICLWGMCKVEKKQWTSYRLMIILGVNHLVGLQTSGLLNGIFAIFGVVHCTLPVWDYALSTVAQANWYSSSIANLVLALNRCCELYDQNLTKKLFGGRKIYVWMYGPILYGVVTYFYAMGCIYNSMWMAFMMDPHAGYYDDTQRRYLSLWHSIHNNFVMIAEILIYGIMVYLFYRLKRESSAEFQSKIKHERVIFVQILLIGVAHTLAGGIYQLMNYVPVNFEFSVVGTAGYFMSQGLPSVIYLCLNKTIQNAIAEKLGCRKRNSRIHVYASGVSAQTKDSSNQQQGATGTETQGPNFTSPIDEMIVEEAD